MSDPAIPLEDLRRRYNALGPITEYIGERTFAGRCSTFESFLEYGSSFADFLNRDPRSVQHMVDDFPDLVALVRETWPGDGKVE